MNTPENNWNMDEALRCIEGKMRLAVQYVHGAETPQMQADSLARLRLMAETLGRLANRMEQPPQELRAE
ncbi:hypothetical protein ACOBR2_01100 [Telmatobacter bradus]|uniref:hypothetical protein n=1 Tax=Telmatobacter bradus TaxID=474953 RepID=UPI003B43633A